MTIEQLLTETLQGADGYLPSSDLFAKVQRSIEEDAAHRRRTRRAALWAAGGVVVAIAWIAAFLEIGDGSVRMPWWTVEVLTIAVLIVGVLVLGPLIRRFGRDLVLEVFHSHQETSKRFLALLDIAYYLIFTAFILMTTSFSAQADWGGRLAAQVELELIRIGGLLLLMGVLHAVTIAFLPVMGLVLASNWWRTARRDLGNDAPAPEPNARQADRVVTVIVWVVAALIALQALGIVPGLLGLILGAE
jgi:hypothetical protein